MPHRYIGICSDTRAGRNDEDASLQELEIPVTTDPTKISQALGDEITDAIEILKYDVQLVRSHNDQSDILSIVHR
ncbi:MAG: hypothetical protein OXH16_01285 [Gemmatimonadetes bacterium]|nr:hypothetical protein [Gemmatimonadota bacterium]